MIKKFLLPLAAVLILTSCGSDSQFDGFTRAEANGLHYKFFSHNDAGKKVDTGCGIKFSYRISSYPKDSVIIDSKQVSRDGSGYTTFRLSKSSFKGSFEDGFLMMHEGDSAAFIISADSFYLKTSQQNALPPGITPGSFLRGVFKIKEVKTPAELRKNEEEQMAEREKMMKDAMANETTEREKYLAANKITQKPTESGLIYIELKKGKGDHPKPTDIVKVHYTGTLLDGTKFDSSYDHDDKAPIEFPLNQVIPGWTEGLGMMAKGGKAKLILPSQIGYGMRQSGPIPPFSTLVFEVELLDFKPGQDPGQMQMQMQQQGGGDGHQHHAGDGHNH